MVVLSARAVRRSGSVPVPACVGGCGVWESYSGCEHLVVVRRLRSVVGRGGVCWVCAGRSVDAWASRAEEGRGSLR